MRKDNLRNATAVLAGVASLLVLTCAEVNCQSANADLVEKRITIRHIDKPLFDVFMGLIYDYDIAIGFEQSNLDGDSNDYVFETNVPYDERAQGPDGQVTIKSGLRPTTTNHLITVDFKNARLEDVMNKIVRQMKHYDWEVKEGVVNIFPTEGREPKFAKLLDLKVRAFSVPQDSEVGAIQALIILKLPEFKEFLSQNGLSAEAVRSGDWYVERSLPVGMSFSDVSFRDLLNAITRAKRGGWILKRAKRLQSHQDKEFIELKI